MKNQIKIVIIVILLAPLLASAQREAHQPNSEGSRIFTGGTFGLQFGTYTFIDIAPIIGYKVTDRFAPGISVTYIYSQYKDPYTGFSYSTNMYGGSVFARYFIFENIFAHVEFQVLNLDVPNSASYYTNLTGYHRQNVANFFIGGGYREAIGGRSSVAIFLLYDIIQDPYSPYQNPVINIGFGFGI